MTEDGMVGWHYRLSGHEFEQAPGIGDGQGSLVHCCPCLSLLLERGLYSMFSVVVARGLSYPVACEIFPDQGSNPCPPYWQADS